MSEKALCILCKSGADWTRFKDDARVWSARCGVCGEYFVHEDDNAIIDKLNFESYSAKVNLVAETIRANEAGLPPFWVLNAKTSGPPEEVATKKVVNEFELIPVHHASKPDEILRAIGEQTQTRGPFSEVKLVERDAYALKINGLEELRDWLADLVLSDYVESKSFKASLANPALRAIEVKQAGFKVTKKGWERLASIEANLGSQAAFIALSFSKDTRPLIQSAIREACEKTGWVPLTVDADEYIGGVMDEVIAKIKRSHFVIAEFTNHSHGVYWEAAFAEGRNMKVIYAVREDQMKQAHFDTRHKNHITWKDKEELTSKLIKKIEAVIPK